MTTEAEHSPDKRNGTDRRRRGLGVRALLRCQRGVTAIEFGLIFPVFAMLVVGIIEVSLMFYSSIVIEGAVSEAGRLIRTGQVQTAADPETTFSDAVCDAVYGVISCDDIYYDVQTFSDFASFSMPITLDDDDEPVTSFSTGATGEITAVRALYYYDFYTPMLGTFFEDSSGSNRRLLVSTAVFRNEPY